MTDATRDAQSTGQLRPGLWELVNERYPGSMIECAERVQPNVLTRPLGETRLCLVSSCGVHERTDPPLDVCHPFGDFGFRRIRSDLGHDELEIQHIKYPTGDAELDINVIFPIERLQELAEDGVIGSLTRHFFAFIGYNMNPPRFQKTVVRDIARAVVQEEGAEAVLLAPA